MASDSYFWDLDPHVGHCSLPEYSTMCHSHCKPTSDVSKKSEENIQSGKISLFNTSSSIKL